MKLTAQEEYGLRCLLRVARLAPAEADALASIREVAEAEGLSVDYTAKLLRVLRQAGLLDAARGATGGYRLSRDAAEIRLSDALGALDSPLFGADFCAGHAGSQSACVRGGDCSLRAVWTAVDAAVTDVLSRLTLAQVLEPEPAVSRRLREEPAPIRPTDPTADHPGSAS